jgi:hypothetical protein
MEMQASAASAFTMVARPGHPHLTILRLIPLLWLTLMMVKEKKAANKMKAMSEASQRPPRYLFGG